MNKKYFILIMVLYIVMVVGDIIVDRLTEFMIPPNVVEMTKDQSVSILILIITLIIPLSYLVGIIGLFCFWKPATYIFSIAVIAMIIFRPILGPWKAITCWSSIFYEFEFLLEGAIIALIFFGPAKNLFIKKSPNKSMEPT